MSGGPPLPLPRAYYDLNFAIGITINSELDRMCVWVCEFDLVVDHIIFINNRQTDEHVFLDLSI